MAGAQLAQQSDEVGAVATQKVGPRAQAHWVTFTVHVGSCARERYLLEPHILELPCKVGRAVLSVLGT